MGWLEEFFVWLNSLFASPSNVVYASTPYGFSMAQPVRPVKISSEGVAFIKHEEGFSPTPYHDGSSYSIGFGHRFVSGDGLNVRSVLTEDQASRLLMNDLPERERTVLTYVKTPLNQNQFNALVSLVYNIGAGNFSRSNLLQRLNANDYAGAQRAFANLNMAGGKPVLTARRSREAQLFGSAGV